MPPLHAQITEHNFEDYLGQDDLYASYLVFFMHEVEQKGIVPTLNTWLFQKSEHQLLVRAVGGAIHALIHIGYGVEFNLPAILAEGLAQAAVHSTMVSPLFPVGFPDTSAAAAGRTRSASQSIASFASRLHLTQPHVDSFVATARKMPVDRAFEPRQGLQGFTVLSYLLADPQLAAGQTNDLSDGNKLRKTIQTSADQILRWASEWAVEETAGESWELCVQTTEELAFIATMLLGATSMRPGYEQSGIPPKLDFFIMHAVTSSIFLPSLLEPLSPHQRVAILRAHWVSFLSLTSPKTYHLIDKTIECHGGLLDLKRSTTHQHQVAYVSVSFPSSTQRSYCRWRRSSRAQQNQRL